MQSIPQWTDSICLRTNEIIGDLISCCTVASQQNSNKHASRNHVFSNYVVRGRCKNEPCDAVGKRSSAQYICSYEVVLKSVATSTGCGNAGTISRNNISSCGVDSTDCIVRRIQQGNACSVSKLIVSCDISSNKIALY